MKARFILVLTLIGLFTLSAGMAGAAEPVLPKIIGPHTLAWDDPNAPSVNVTGYHVWYRAIGAKWDDSRMVTVAAPTKTQELTAIITANGSYELAISAVNASGESALSAPIPFTLSIPSSVSNSRVQ